MNVEYIKKEFINYSVYIMNLNYRILSSNKKSKNGTCYILNENSSILTECVFNISRMKIDKKFHRTIVFTSWTHTSFDGKKDELEQFINETMLDEIYMMCIYNNDTHSNNIEKDIKTDISKRVLEFTKIES